MKHVLKKALWVLLPGIFAVLGSCSDDKTETVAPPVVSFPVTDAEMEVDVEEEITFEAVVENDEEAGCIWYVNGVAAASTPTMTYAFTQVGLYTVRCEVYNDGGRVAKVYKVKVNGIPLEVEFSDSGDEVSCDQGDEVRISATVVGGDKEVKHSWSIDGTVVSETADFIHTFMEPGTFTLAYAGVNAYRMTATKGWTVRVAEVELPLTIEFSPVSGAIDSHRGDEVVISTSVKGGAEGLVHEWKVDGETVSTDAVFSRAFDGTGPYTIAYHAVNSKQETVDRTWTVTMVPSGALFEHFEDYTELPKWWTLKQNDPGIQLADNPKPEGINTSAKVLSDKVNGTGGTSGYFDLKLKDSPADKIDVTKYTGIRFKIYLGKNKYYPRVQYNDTRHQPVTKPQFRDEWEVLEYRFGANLDPTKTITFRPMLKEDGSNIASGAVTETNTRTVYIDDIEFLE